jgi:hypothetical protein
MAPSLPTLSTLTSLYSVRDAPLLLQQLDQLRDTIWALYGEQIRLQRQGELITRQGDGHD